MVAEVEVEVGGHPVRHSRVDGLARRRGCRVRGCEILLRSPRVFDSFGDGDPGCLHEECDAM
ncbi:hypothetical protein DBV08_23480 [Rhodococcus sp. KBW08]|nr:hypothetical protein DBV08_23480 [Rhodococcus sp. KBW08]